MKNRPIKSSKKSSEKSNIKVPPLSPESVTFAFVMMLSAQNNSASLMQFLQSVFTGQDINASVLEIDKIVKQNLLLAVQITCALPLIEKLLSERSVRSLVACIYILVRLANQQTGVVLSQTDKKKLWEEIWIIAKRFPLAESEWKDKEELNDLKDWKVDIQNYSRDKWRYFNKVQLPHTYRSTENFHKNMLGFLNLNMPES